jgi:hypothetical protein
MMKPIATVFLASFFLACGGSQPAAGGVSDLSDDAADPADAPSPRPSDGIVRDADGDGVPDDAGAGCEGKNQTQCQITAGCAWSDTDQCVEAGG